MQKILALFLLTLNLWGSFFSTDTKTTSYNAIKEFRAAASIGNVIIKKGEYQKYPQFEKKIRKIETQIKTFDLSNADKEAIHNKINKYKQEIGKIAKNMKNNTPDIAQNYTKALRGLVTFNNSINSTGWRPLIKEWRALTKIKHNYIKHPSAALNKKFHQKLESVILVLTDLCLDEELEDPMLEYLVSPEKPTF